jgi:hypothetical protein
MVHGFNLLKQKHNMPVLEEIVYLTVAYWDLACQDMNFVRNTDDSGTIT